MTTYNLKLAIGLDGVPQVVGGLKQVEAQVEQAGGRTQSATGRMAAGMSTVTTASGRMATEHGRHMGQMSHGMTALEMRVQALTMRVMNLTMAAALVAAPFVALGLVLKSTYGEIEQFNLSAIQMAALISSFQKGGDPGENYRKAKEYAEGLVPVLEAIDAETAASASGLQIITEEMIKQRVLLDGNNTAAVEGFKNLANAASVIASGYQNQEIQLRQEIRSLMQGEVDMNSQLSQQINAMVGGGLKDKVELWKKEGTIIENLGGLLRGYGAASEDIGATWSAIGSTMSTIWSQISRGGFTEMYRDVNALLASMNDYLKAHAADIGGVVRRGYLAVVGTLETIGELWQAIAPAVMTVLRPAWELTKMIFDGWGMIAYAVLPEVAERIKAMLYLVYDFAAVLDSTARLLIAALTFNVDGMQAYANDLKTVFGTIGTDFKKAFGPELLDEVFARVDEYQRKAGQKNFVELPGLDEPKDEKALKAARERAEQYAQTLRQLADARRASNPLLSDEARETERLAIQYDALVAKYPAHRAELERNRAMDLQQLQLSRQLRAEQEQTKRSFAALTAAMAEGQAVTESVATAQQRFNAEIERLDALFLAGHVGLDAYWRKIEQLYVELESGPKKAAAEFRALMDEINGMSFEAPGVTSFGDPLTDGIGKAVEAVNRLNLAYANQQKHLAAIEAQRVKIDKTTVKGSKEQADALAALGKQEQRAAEVNFQTQLGGYRELFGTTKSLFAEQSKERKALHALEQTFAAIEIALNLQKAVSAAVTAVATQGSGDPYSAFARIAAMAALMGGVLAMAGISFGGGGGGGVSAPAAKPGSGTVLGDPTAVSDSSARVLELLEDIHASEYRELRGIHDSMRDLNNNIKGIVSGIFRTIGGFGGFEEVTSSNLAQKAVGWQQKHDSNVLVQAFSGGIMELLAKPVEKLLGGTLGAIAGGLLKLPGQVFDKLFEWGGKASEKLFGGKVRTSVTGSGLAVGAISIGDLLGGQDAQVQQYADIYRSKSGGWFGKKKISTWREYSTVDGEITRLITQVFSDMGQTLTTLAGGLGADVNRALAYVFKIDAINLKDKSSEEINQILSGVIGAAGDSAAKAILGEVISAYQQVGEGLLETAVRLYATQEVVRDTLEMTGQQMSGDAIALSQALADLAGGVKELREAAESYYDKFFSDAEKQADLTKKLSASMGDLNMILPASRQGYRNLVEALDLNNEADRERYVRLIELASGADRYYKALEEGAEKALASLRQNLTDTLGAARNAAEALRQILGGPLGGASPERLYAERLQAFEAARRLGRADELPELGKALLEASRAYNASGAGYQSDLDTVTRALGQIAGIQGSPTLSAAERQVQLLDDIRAAIEEENLAQLQLLSAQTGLLRELVRQYLGAQGQRPSFAVGSAYIPRDMTADIHQGEMIIDRASAQVLRKYGIPASGGDNREVVRVLEKMEARLERVEAHTAANVRVNQAGFSQTIALNEKQAAASTELASKTRLAGAA